MMKYLALLVVLALFCPLHGFLVASGRGSSTRLYMGKENRYDYHDYVKKDIISDEKCIIIVNYICSLTRLCVLLMFTYLLSCTITHISFSSIDYHLLLVIGK